jgi:hypothetical protein
MLYIALAQHTRILYNFMYQKKIDTCILILNIRRLHIFRIYVQRKFRLKEHQRTLKKNVNLIIVCNIKKVK